MKRDFKNYTIVSSFLLCCFLLLSCNGCSVESPDLSGGYMLWGKWRMITSKQMRYLNVIYPVVTDYVYNDNFILAEQHPRKDYVRVNLGENLLRRFQDYQLYNKDPSILKDSFYSHLKGLVEKDSLLYKDFIYYGAKSDESKNREIAIHMAEYMVKNNSYYKTILSRDVNYWIIVLATDSLIGPLTKKEYLIKKQKLNVLTNLKLSFEE